MQVVRPRSRRVKNPLNHFTVHQHHTVKCAADTAAKVAKQSKAINPISVFNPNAQNSWQLVIAEAVRERVAG